MGLVLIINLLKESPGIVLPLLSLAYVSMTILVFWFWSH